MQIISKLLLLSLLFPVSGSLFALPLLSTSETTVVEKSIAQPVDHFRSGSKLFNQRYWISNYYAENKNSPILIYLCGEINCEAKLASPYLDRWAQPVNGFTVTIEHRYYGKSQPFNDLTTENLKYLELKQVLRDYAGFIHHLRQQEQLSGPVILIGGSYSGLLAAMMRTEFPSLVAGAWSSSGPLHLIADYQQYDEAMSKTIPDQCRQKLRNLSDAIESKIADDASYETLLQKFLVPDMKNKKDFLFGLIDIAAAAVQYNRTNWFCDKFQGGDPIEEYGVFVTEIANKWEYKIDSYGFSAITDSSLTSANANMRVFIYQQCSELGLFQPASKNRELSTRSAALDMEYMLDGCKRVFGKDFDLQDKIKFLNHKYYDRMIKPNGPSNIFSTAGTLDPFSQTSITPKNGNATNKNMQSMDIEQSAHCSDLNYTESSPPSAIQAAELAKDLIKRWVGQQ